MKKSTTEQKSRITLMERTKTFNDLCRIKQNTLHPKSENLSPLVSEIVKKLEDSFDGLSERMKSSPSPGTQWKSQALAMTISEIPKISMCGQESGDYTGYGRHIYTSPGAPKSKISSKYIKPDGTWRSFSDINSELKKANTHLTRSKILRANSGRYVDEI